MYDNHVKNINIARVIKLGAEFQIIETAKGDVGIWHKECGMVSYNHNDIAEKYCGLCHKFLL